MSQVIAQVYGWSKFVCLCTLWALGIVFLTHQSFYAQPHTQQRCQHYFSLGSPFFQNFALQLPVASVSLELCLQFCKAAGLFGFPLLCYSVFQKNVSRLNCGMSISLTCFILLFSRFSPLLLVVQCLKKSFHLFCLVFQFLSLVLSLLWLEVEVLGSF